MITKAINDNQNQTNEVNPILEQKQIQIQNQSKQNTQPNDFPEINIDNVDGNENFIDELDKKIDNELKNNNPSLSTNPGTGTVENTKKESIIIDVERIIIMFIIKILIKKYHPIIQA